MSDEIDWQAFGRDYKRFLKVLAWVAHTPSAYRYHLAGYSARYLSPQAQEFSQKLPQIIADCYPNGEYDPQAVWLRYLHHVGASYLNVFRFAHMGPRWLQQQVEIDDKADIKKQLQRGKGLLLMSYHNHYPLLFAASIGMMGLPIHPIANDPKNSPVYPYLKDLATQYYDDSEAHFSGGKYCYVANETSVGSLRKIAKVLRQGHILLSLNDFPAPAGSHYQPLSFFNQTANYPIGGVEMALRQKAPIVIGWIRWIATERFVLELHAIEATDVATVMQQYQYYLHQLIKADPGNWEGWNWMNFREDNNA